MAEPAPQSWTVDAFFSWQEGQADRYELVDGRPSKMMADARNVHDDIVVNLTSELRGQLRGRDCRPFTGDGSVETRPGQIRRPDVGVDCGPRDPNAMKAAMPKLIVEVLSPSTRDFDSFAKLEEYKAIPSVDYIVLVEPNAPVASFWSRDEDSGWSERRVVGLTDGLEMPKLAINLKMEAVYADVTFPSGPRLVYDDAVRLAEQRE